MSFTTFFSFLKLKHFAEMQKWIEKNKTLKCYGLKIHFCSSSIQWYLEDNRKIDYLLVYMKQNLYFMATYFIILLWFDACDGQCNTEWIKLFPNEIYQSLVWVWIRNEAFLHNCVINKKCTSLWQLINIIFFTHI